MSDFPEDIKIDRSPKIIKIGGDIVIDSIVEGKFHFVPDVPPKIEFRYVVEFEPYVPTPECYDMEKPLEELTNGELAEMASMDAEDAIDKIEFFEPKDIYVEVVIDGTVFRRVKCG